MFYSAIPELEYHVEQNQVPPSGCYLCTVIFIKQNYDFHKEWKFVWLDLISRHELYSEILNCYELNPPSMFHYFSWNWHQVIFGLQLLSSSHLLFNIGKILARFQSIPNLYCWADVFPHNFFFFFFNHSKVKIVLPTDVQTLVLCRCCQYQGSFVHPYKVMQASLSGSSSHPAPH